MTTEQAARIIEEIWTRKKAKDKARDKDRIIDPHAPPAPTSPGPGEPGLSPRPYVPIAVLLVSGTLFTGMGWVNTHGDIEMSVERLSEAHIMKGPVSIWINIDAVQAITEV